MTIAEMFSNEYLAEIVIKALIVGVLVSVSASLLGVSLVLKRYSMIGDGLSHVGFGTTALATVLGLGNYSLEFSIPIVIIIAVILLRLNENSRVNGDAAIAIFSTGAVAIGSLLFNYTGQRNTDVCNALFGSSSIITLTDKDLVLSIVLSVIVIVLFILFYTKIFAMTFDERFANATGVKTGIYKNLVAILTAVTIVLGMKMMGAIMISGLIVFPALSAMRICKNFKGVMICSGVLSVMVFLAAFFTACRFSLQTGPTVVTFHIILYIIFAGIERYKK